MKNPARFAASLALLLPLALAGCGSGSNSGAATMRLVNADPTAPYNFDILVNSAASATNQGYGTATPFASVNSGSVTVQWEATGTKQAVLTAGFSAQGGVPYSVLAINGNSGLSYLVAVQPNSTVATGQVRLNFLDAAPALGALDIFVTGPTDALPLTPAFAALTYPGDAAAVTPSVSIINSGDYRIRAIADGDATRTVVFDSGRLSSVSGTDLLATIVPVGGSASKFALLMTAADSTTYPVPDQRALLRFANFAPAQAPMDAFLDASGVVNSTASLAAQNLALDAFSAYQSFFPGIYTASMASTGQTAQVPGLGLPVVVTASTSVSIFAVGISGQSAPANLQLLALTDNLQAPASGTANLRVVALAPDLGAVDVVLLNSSGAISGQPLSPNLAYLGATQYIPMLPGSYTLALVPTGTDLPVLPASTGYALSPTAGSVYTLVISGCRFPGSGVCATSASALGFKLLQDR